MIPAQYYLSVYLLIVTVITFVAMNKYGRMRISRLRSNTIEPISPSLLLCLFMAVFIGIRPISSVFVDMGATAAAWYKWNMGTYHFTWNVENKLYDNLRMLMSTAHIPVEYFFFLISMIYFGAMYAACRKLFPKDTLFAFLVCLAAFSTFSYGTNGVKAGSAASLFLVALAYHDNKWLTIIFALLSWGFHHSMIMVVASYLIVYFYHKPKSFFILWVISVIVAALHIGVFQGLFASMADDHGAEYLMEQSHGKGFRIDFILYSAMPVLVGYYAIFKHKIRSKTYNIILCLYLMTNSIWMLCMYAEFTNRIAYLSWFQYPIVLIYPFLKTRWGRDQYPLVRNIAYAHLAFTLFMEVIFYA